MICSERKHFYNIYRVDTHCRLSFNIVGILYKGKFSNDTVQCNQGRVGLQEQQRGLIIF